MAKKRLAKPGLFQEDYWYNSSEYHPDFPGIRIHSFCHSLFMPDKLLSSPRRYDYIMASIILSGNSIVKTELGDVIVHSKNYFSISDLNTSINSRYGSHNDTLERYFVLFRINRTLRKVISELFPSGNSGFIAPQPQRLLRCFEDIRKILRKQGTSDDHLLSAMGFKLLTEAAEQTHSLNTVPLPLTLALRCIDSTFSQPDCTRKKIAQAAGISEASLGKLFRTYLDTSVNAYVTAMRIEKAKQLLEFSTEPVSTVSEQCGFAWAYYFARVFKEHTGMTPLEYRKKAGD